MGGFIASPIATSKVFKDEGNNGDADASDVDEDDGDASSSSADKIST